MAKLVDVHNFGGDPGVVLDAKLCGRFWASGQPPGKYRVYYRYRLGGREQSFPHTETRNIEFEWEGALHALPALELVPGQALELGTIELGLTEELRQAIARRENHPLFTR